MDRPTPILLVTGPPASGKSFVAELLADRPRLPLIEKDAIKETLFEALGTGDDALSKQLARATSALMYWALEVQLKARRPVIVEANLAADDARPELQTLHGRHPFKALELHFTASEEVLMARYAARAGARHPGHRDVPKMPEIASAVAAGRYRPLRLGRDDPIVIDTTSFDDVDTAALLTAPRDHLTVV